MGFASTFREAVMRGDAPDIVVFDNHGVMTGITTALGTFEGIGEDPTDRHQFVRVTDAFDELLGPQRGWTYLFASSRNHETARRLALRTPACPVGFSGPKPQGALAQVVTNVAAAYLSADASRILTYSDPDRLPARPSNLGPITVGSVQTCGAWGNGKLAFASAIASYDAETTIGHRRVLLALRRASDQWLLLAAARDPISNGEFVTQVASMIALLATDDTAGPLPESATLLSPAPGDRPQPIRGQRFGTFTWRPSLSPDVVAEIAEFAYHDDARLFVSRPARPDTHSAISAGRLWTTNSEWSWRIWSVSKTGDVAFSEARNFAH